VTFTLQPGDVTETVRVDSELRFCKPRTLAVRQVISTKEINDTPLNGRNWVYIAQLTKWRCATLREHSRIRQWRLCRERSTREQNNFILDGV